MKKVLLFSLILVATFVFMVGCDMEEVAQPALKETPKENVVAEKANYVFLTPKSAPAYPALLMKEQGIDNLEINTWDTVEQLVASLQKNEAQFTAVPLNVAATLAKKMPLQLINVNTWGTIFMVSTDESVKSLADLQNETIFVSHKSGPPDVLIRYLLEKEGLLDKVTLQYATPPEISQLIISGKIKHAVLPEPSLSGVRMQLKDKLFEVIDFQKTWMAEYNQSLPQAGIVVNANWAKANPKAVQEFLEAYQHAAENIMVDQAKTASVVARAFEMKEPVVQSSLNKMIIQAVPALEAKPAIEKYFNTLLLLQPEAIGESLPDEGFYYKP
ncbi:hypothetical protein BHU72_13750 [Desulfuribacillus stibiiarsenatis]|uniref:SsuA/THI5-like domain-containing protein n=1 Tax=Desulfuribacillus stibiiarsenatis TaxID=1390249 RepID=A0A1E5L814_9FIRM|nr:MqnA/MqnD/SBP family protein [Desulfuribacillus stibiiarsenatis]OEH86285.1 hypothetical protein BHU72_13750 [Desulfuribacillus stibiiarsenatis]